MEKIFLCAGASLHAGSIPGIVENAQADVRKESMQSVKGTVEADGKEKATGKKITKVHACRKSSCVNWNNNKCGAVKKMLHVIESLQPVYDTHNQENASQFTAT